MNFNKSGYEFGEKNNMNLIPTVRGGSWLSAFYYYFGGMDARSSTFINFQIF